MSKLLSVNDEDRINKKYLDFMYNGQIYIGDNDD